MSFTSLVTSSTLLPPASTLATITGIMSGEIRIMVGEPTPSSNLAFTWSSRLEISMEAESILVPCIKFQHDDTGVFTGYGADAFYAG